MVGKKRISGGSKAEGSRLIQAARRRRANMSRKAVAEIADAKKRSKTIAKRARQMVQDSKAMAAQVKERNRKLNKNISKSSQKAVNEGLADAIRAVGGTPTPLTTFAAAMSALATDLDSGATRVSYLLNAIGAALPQLSPNVLLAKLDALRQVCIRVISTCGKSDNVAVAKAYRVLTDASVHAVASTVTSTVSSAQMLLDAGDEVLARSRVDKFTNTLPAIFQRAFVAVKALDAGGAGSTAQFAGSMRRFLIHLFTLDDRNKRVFGIDHDSDEDWEDVESDDEGSAAEDTGKPAQSGGSWIAGELIWALRRQVLDVAVEVTAALLAALPDCSSSTAGKLIDNLSEILTVLVGRCVAEYAGFVLREGGAVDEQQTAMLSGVLEPILQQIVNAFRASSSEQAYWASLATLVNRVFQHSRLSIFKRSAYAPSVLRLAHEFGLPPPLHRVVKNPSASAVQNVSSGELSEKIAADEASAQHFQKALPPLFDIAPSTVMLLRILDKIRAKDEAGLNKSIEDAIVAIGGCVTMRMLLDTLQFDPHNDASNATWRHSYLLHSVWRRVAHHDSLVTFASEFLPRIADCQSKVLRFRDDERLDEAQQFEMLLLQYWRVAVGFFTFPVEIDEASFRNIAKALVSNVSRDRDGVLSPTAHACCAALHAFCNGYYQLAADRDVWDTLDDEDDAEDEDEGQFGDLLLERDDDVLHPHRHHFITYAHALRGCAIASKYSRNIMPRLCNAAEGLSDVAGTPILAAISSFARVCDPGTMDTVLKSILNVGANIASGEGEMTSQRRVILDIAIGIIPHLDAKFLEAIASVVVSAVSMPLPSLQKKGYRLLFELFEHRLRDVSDQLPALIGTLQAASAATLPPARKLRLRCLGWALDACKLYSEEQLVEFGLGFVDEVVLAVRERSHQAREFAMQWFDQFFRYCENRVAPNGYRAQLALLHRVLAGLAGKSPLSVAASILVSAKLVWCGCAPNRCAFSEAELSSVVSLIIPLVDHVATEIRSAAVVFARMSLKLGAKQRVLASALCPSTNPIPKDCPLARLMHGIAVTVSQPHVASTTRNQMRQLLERCLEYFTVDQLQQVFPSGSVRFLLYVDRQKRRASRTKERLSEREEERRIANRMLQNDGHGQRLEETADEFDILGESGLAQLATLVPQQQRGRKSFVSDENDEEDDGYVLSMANDGKMQILTASAKARMDSDDLRQQTAEKLMRQAAATSRGKRAAIHGPTIAAAEINDEGKRRRTDDMADFENEELFRAHGGVGDNNASKPAKPAGARGKAQGPATGKRNRMEHDLKKGSEFGSATGLGDVKKGSVEPYAYVPLNRALLNKRNQAQRVTRFKAVDYKALRGKKAQRAAAELKRQQN